MRLPISKIYRAFPELDRFSDEQCLVYVARARSRKLGSGCLMLVGASLAGIGAAAVMAILTSQLFLPIAKSMGLRASAELELAGGMLLFGAHIVVAFLVGLMIRDAWLRRAILGCLESDRCPKCDYSLLGLPVHAGVVTCPECGFASELKTMGVTEEDLLSPR